MHAEFAQLSKIIRIQLATQQRIDVAYREKTRQIEFLFGLVERNIFFVTAIC